MNRRKFLKGIGTVTAATIITPHVILSKPPVVETIGGNEGLWQQLHKSNITKYGSPNGITREHIKEAVEYVFRDREPRTERFVTIKTDKKGEERIKDLMNAYIINGVTYTV